jgi:hypothetical protein
MVNIVDLIRRGDEHGNINIPIIRILAEQKIAKHIWISSDSTSNQFLLKNHEGSVTQIKVYSTKKYKWITSTLLTLKILNRGRKKEIGTLFLSTTPLHNLLITAYTLIKKSNVRNYVLLHGELTYLINPIGIGRRLGKFFLDITFKILPFSNTTQVTLAYPVFAALNKKYHIDRKLINLEQPTETIDYVMELRNKNRKLRIGSFGVHSKDKNSQLIYDLANHLENNYEQFEIVTIGVANTDFIYDQHPMVKHYCRGSLNNALIPRRLFIEEVKKLDIALFFYGDSPQYEMAASGAFIECFNSGIPFLALSSNYLNHYIDKYGEIGFVGNSLAELAAELNNISKDDSIIEVYKKHLKAARDDRTYEKFKDQLLKIL